MITLKNINKSYEIDKNRKQDVLCGITYTFPSDGFYSVLGKSGSGKSTLFNILGGIDRYDSGTYHFGNLDVSSLDNNKWDILRDKYISYVFQDLNLLEYYTVMENLQFANHNLEKSEINKVLGKLGLLDKVDSYPNKLSGGEKQRIALARSVLKNASVLLVDEPTGNLDEENSKIVLDFLKEISKNKLVIMITHDEGYARNYSDKVLCLNNGVFDDNSSTDIEQIDIDLEIHSPLTISTKQAMKISFHNILKKKKKFIQYIILIGFSLLMLGLGLVSSNINIVKTFTSTLNDNGEFYYDVRSVNENYFDEQTFLYIDSILDDPIGKSYTNGTIHYMTNNEEYITSQNYGFKLGTFIDYNSNIKLNKGFAPIEYNEVVISDYVANSILRFELIDVNSIDDLLGKTIPQTNLVIVGIYDTDFEQYTNILDSSEFYFYKEDLDEGIKSDILYKIDKVYSNLLVSKDNFSYSESNIRINGLLANNDFGVSLDLKPISFNNMSFNLTTNSLEIETVNDIYITREIVYKLLQSDYENYASFMIAWVTDKIALTDELINKEVTIEHSKTNQEYNKSGFIDYFNEETYVIKGVIDDDSLNSYAYLNNSKIDEMFRNNFSIVVFFGDNAKSDVKVLYENEDFTFDSLYGHLMLSVDEDSRIIVMIAFIGSAVLLLFVGILFNNLIGRDILDRKKEIGIIRSLGYSQFNVFKLYFGEMIIVIILAIVLSIFLLPFASFGLNEVATIGNNITIIAPDVLSIFLLIVISLVYMVIIVFLPYHEFKKLKLIDLIREL